MSKVFEIDFDRLMLLLLPTALRKPRLFALLQVMVVSLRALYNTFIANRDRNIAIVNVTPQVCYLRGVLNDTFDPDTDSEQRRRITIGDGTTSDWVILYNNTLFNNIGGKQPVWLSKATSTSTSEMGAITYSLGSAKLFAKQDSILSEGFDFVVTVPDGILYDMARLRAIVDFYKLAGKRYDVQ